MFFKKKKEQLTEEQTEMIQRLDAMKKFVLQLQSDLNYGLIAEWQYNIRIYPILEELREMEKKMNIETFDEMMGCPMEWMEELFHFEDKAVIEIEDNVDPVQLDA